MFINNFDPVAFNILSLEIRWYSLAYIFGILIGWFLCKKIFIKNSDIGEKFDDYITYLIIGIILGGRLGYIIFYNFNYYLHNILDIFKIWQGGMSFHGGLLGIIFSSIIGVVVTCSPSKRSPRVRFPDDAPIIYKYIIILRGVKIIL